jgi:CRISPR-associated protein Cas2
MKRRRRVVAYDIRDQKRLRRVHRLLKGYGDPLQYSVFVCDVTTSELVEMRWQLGEIIHQLEDQVLIIDLGDADLHGTDRFDFLGRRPPLPSGDATIL